jgi:glutaredoxin
MFYILTRPDCPWCDKAKELLNDKGEDHQVFLYTEHPLIVKLMFKAGLKSVPQIWHNGDHIGGYEALALYLLQNED